MLRTCCNTSSDMGFPTQQPRVSSFPRCKLEILPSHFHSKLLLGFDSHTHLLAASGISNVRELPKMRRSRVCVELKPHGHCKIVELNKKNVNHGNNNKYGGVLHSVLRSLKVGNDVESVLALHYEKLSPKEQTVILKDQRKWDKVLRVFEWFKSQDDYVPNVIHYNVVLRSLGRARKWDELRLCWIEMSKCGVLPTNNTYGMLVDVYGKSGLVKEALLWIKHMKMRGIFPDEVTMCTAIKVLKDAGEFDRADRFYKNWCVGSIDMDVLDLDNLNDLQVEPVSLKEFLLTELFRTGGRAKSSTNSTSSEMNNSVRKPKFTATYNTLIDLYGKAGRLKDAADVFSDMLKSGLVLDTFTFNTMIFICGSQGSISEAEALFNEMEVRGISPDTKTYNIFISLYDNAGKTDEVFRCYSKIRAAGLFPDEVTYRAIIQILCDKKMVQEVEGVIEEIEKSQMCVDENSLPILTKMYVDEGLIDRAAFLVEKSLSYGGISSRTYAAVIDVYAEKGLWDKAEDLFCRKRGGEQKKEVLEYNVMIKAYGMAKFYDKALSLFKGMRNRGTWPDQCTFNSLIQMLAGGDLVDHARNLVTEMLEAGFKPSCQTFSSIIASLAKKSSLSDAVCVYKEMLRVDVQPNEVVYGLLIDAFAEAGKFEEAIYYFNVMENSGISANQIVLTSMIKAYGKIGAVEGAKELYERIKILDGGPDIVASNSMLNLYAEFGMVSEAKVIFDHLRERESADGVTFATMMYVYKNMGMLEEAVAVAKEMIQSGLVRDCVSYSKVMACYATSGHLVQCGELLREMIVNQKLLPDRATFKVLFTILKKGNIPTEAVRQLESSYEEGKLFARQAVITSVYSVVGLHEYALESCGIYSREDVGSNSFAYNVAIRAFSAYGKTDEALRMFMKMQDEGLDPDVVTLISLVNCYGKAGMVEGIKRIYGQLKYGVVEPSESLYNAVIDAYKDCNRPDLVELVTQELRFAFDAQQLTDSETDNEPTETSPAQ